MVSPEMLQNAANPWSYRVSVAIPYLSSPKYPMLESTEIVCELLRAQTVKPFVMIVDTGSSWEEIKALEKLRREDVEIHYIRGNKWQHYSEVIAVALDLMWSACRTPYFFTTHNDCFPRRRDLLESLILQCKPERPVVGYSMDQRPGDEWQRCVSHTCTMFHVEALRNIGMAWSMRVADHVGMGPRIDMASVNGWPDTEITFNRCLRRAGITPTIIGQEQNLRRTVDANIDHSKSQTIFAEDRYSIGQQSMTEARRRVEEWAKEGNLHA
jgi:hypothetical protein